jgi:hypothetical protein
MADVHATRGPHARQHAIGEHESGGVCVTGSGLKWNERLQRPFAEAQQRLHDVVEHAERQQADDRNSPNGSSWRTRGPRASGNRLTAMRPPSSGGMGRRFSAINTRLTETPILAISTMLRTSNTPPRHREAEQQGPRAAPSRS